jgi:hypothetical protein
MTANDLKVGQVINQKLGAAIIQVRISEISEGPNGSLRIVVQHPALESVGVKGSKAIFWPAQHRNAKLPASLIGATA